MDTWKGLRMDVITEKKDIQGEYTWVDGRMPLESPRKPVDAFSEGGSYPTSQNEKNSCTAF